jgi:hypothetical protein
LEANYADTAGRGGRCSTGRLFELIVCRCWFVSVLLAFCNALLLSDLLLLIFLAFPIRRIEEGMIMIICGQRRFNR